MFFLFKKRKVFIFEGYIPRGGAYMAYKVGVILVKHFGYKGYVVSSNGIKKNEMFNYSYDLPVISVEKMIEIETEKDLLIINPSFSGFMFGLKVKSKTLSYVQGFNTFSLIDGFLDYYVSVSKVVQDYIQRYYDIQSNIINAFINPVFLEEPPIPWGNKKNEVAIITKSVKKEVYDEFMRLYKNNYPDSDIAFVDVGKFSQEELVKTINNTRYLLSLSPLEGFGLIPLEAMSLGSCVIAFHAWGGLEYMKDGENCEVTMYPKLDLLAEKLNKCVTNNDYAYKLAENGMKVSKQFTYTNFEKEWVSFFKDNVEIEE